MCLTLPEVLVTVMGIEKLLPTWRDLEVFMQLLPRSSTAERMNPYTSMWTGVTPGDGPQTFHLILLDNGRTDVLSDATGRQALRCIRCSACLNVCPVYERTGGQAYGSVYPGPIGAILTPQLRGIAKHPVDKQTASLPFASSLCGACFEVCPVRIDIPEVLVHLRGQVVRGTEATHRLPTAEGRRVRRCRVRVPKSAPSRVRGADGGSRRPAVRASRADPADARSGPDRWLVPGARPEGAGARVVPGVVAADRRRAGRGVMADAARGHPRSASARPSRTGRPPVAIPRDYEAALPPGTDVVELFVERVDDYRATVHRATEATLPEVIADVLAARGARRIVVPAGIPERVARARPTRPGRRRPAALLGRPRRHRRRHHRLRGRHRRDRHDRPRRRSRPGSPGAQPPARPPRLRRAGRADRRAPCPRRSPASTRRAP